MKNLMLKSTLGDLILEVGIIIAVTLAFALCLFFVLSIIYGIVNRNRKVVSDSSSKDDAVQQTAEKELGVSNFSLEKTENQEAEEEKVVNEEPFAVYDVNRLIDVDDDKADMEEAEAEEALRREEQESAERREYLDARRQELLRRMQEDSSEEPEQEVEAESKEVEEAPVEETVEEPSETENETDEDDDFRRLFDDVVADEQQTEEQPVEEETVSEEEPEKAEEVEEEPVVAIAEEETVEEETPVVEEEKVEEPEQEVEAELKEVEEAPVEETVSPEPVVEKVIETVVINNKLAGLSIDELKEKLNETQERLKSTEKEFKQCKKEYVPLRKVWTAYEKDAKKLRRKEALVARQKSMLYGVNKMDEIDQEKATKLAEDMDLMDGLKLSVQHCEEVMKENKERYPLLEKMYGVLKQRNDELKQDIETYTAEIERLEKKQAEVNSSNSDNE